MKKHILIGMVIFWITLAWAFQGQRGIWQPDEGYYVGVAVTMNQQNNYLVPQICEEVFLDKPPLLYWGILLGHNLFGSGEFAYRFSTGLAFFMTCILIFFLARSFSGRYREGFWASIIYSTMALTFSAANFITMDTTLTFFTTLSMFAFWQSIKPDSKHSTAWKMILCLAVGFGFLTKGPAALIPTGAMFIYLLASRKVVSYFLTPWALLGFILFCISGLSWYIYISLKLPGAAEYFIDNQFLGRLVTDKYQRNPGLQGAFIYLPIIFLGAMPWAADWFRKDGMFKYFKAAPWKALLANPESLFIACWIIIPMTVLCLASSKLGLYALPVFPALALATAKLRPEITNVSMPLIDKRSLVFVAALSFALISSRFALAYYPWHNDCRDLWSELQPHIPAGEYEIVAVDDRVDGLVFYNIMEIETVTRRIKPYPAYMRLETVQQELQDMQIDGFPHLFIVKDLKHVPELKQALLDTGWSIRQFLLQHERVLLYSTPQQL